MSEEDAGAAAVAAEPGAGFVVAVAPPLLPLPAREEEPAFVAPPPLPAVVLPAAALGLYADAPPAPLLLAPGLFPEAPPAGLDLDGVVEEEDGVDDEDEKRLARPPLAAAPEEPAPLVLPVVAEEEEEETGLLLLLLVAPRPEAGVVAEGWSCLFVRGST